MKKLFHSPVHRREFIASMLAELDHAYEKHGADPWNRHEFAGVLLEEVDELWEAIKQDKPLTEVLKESMQVACVCLRYAETPDRRRGAHSLPLPCRIDMNEALKRQACNHADKFEGVFKAFKALCESVTEDGRVPDEAVRAAGAALGFYGAHIHA